MDFMKKDDLISMKQVEDLLQKVGIKTDAKEKRAKTWLIVSITVLVLAIAAAVVYKVFFYESDDFDDFDEYEDDFDDMDYDEDYEDFDDFDEEDEFVDDLEEDQEDVDAEDVEK